MFTSMPIAAARRHARRCFSASVSHAAVLPLSHDIHAPKPLPEGGSRPAGGGSPAPILVLHGLFGSKQNWRSLSKSIAAKTGSEVVPVDLRNHGDSPHAEVHSYEAMTADVEALCEKLGFPKVMLIGHSMGGKTAMHMALSRPHKVEKLVVVDMAPTIQNLGSLFGGYIESMKKVEAMNIKTAKAADAVLAERIKELPIRQFLLTNLKPPADPNAPLRFRINISSLEKALRTDSIAGFPLYNSLVPYRGPSLFLRGLKANYVTEKHFPDIGRLFPNSEIVGLDAGHWVHSEKPQEFVQTVSEFLVRP
ncbi:mitochondrial hydrolase [Zopfochytrium polystomum]|nr:mitochondrial hydrolase [Zopfochytrium polystomum]